MLRFCFPLLFAVLLLSCLSEPDCVVTASSTVKILFMNPSFDSARFVEFDSIVVSGTDTLFHVGDSVDYVTLPVRPDAFLTTYYFYYETREDSITVSYTRATRVISPSCGAFNYYQDLNVLVNTFPAVGILNHELSTSDAPNIRIGL